MIAIKASKVTELCGWYGMLALIGAYGLVSFDIIAAQGLLYQLLNLSGGVTLIVFSLSKKATQLAILNAFWALIGVIAIVRLY